MYPASPVIRLRKSSSSGVSHRKWRLNCSGQDEPKVRNVPGRPNDRSGIVAGALVEVLHGFPKRV